MNNRLLLVFAFCLLCACASTHALQPSRDAVYVEEQSARVRFGELYQGEKFQAEFVIVNRAPYQIVVERIENTCGCTTSLLSGEAIRPNEQQILHVDLDTARLWGPQSKAVILHTDDPHRRTIRLMVEGVVKERIVCEPRRLNVQTNEERWSARVRLTNTTPEALTIKAMTIEPNEHMTAALVDKALPCTLAAGETVFLEVVAELARPDAKLVGQIHFAFAEVEANVSLPFYLERVPPKSKNEPRSP